MELFGMPLETIYLYGLVISGAVTILYLFFGDVLEGITEAIPFVNPTLIFSFVTIFSAGGYLGEALTKLNSVLIAVASAIIALIIVTLLNVFVLIPLSNAEESLVYKESDLRGRIGTVITGIPVDGYGEVLIENISGRISKPAASFTKSEIPYGKKVLVIDVENGVLQVKLYEELETYI
ncbi:NfeD family protein [Mesobacillus selenatarsenatis]|uniref:Putative membrane protein n=1 Tax=Mesobacillus selenatarsenatis (strain DSM 18680 / JCM 14380 / FERM P-15431 / SF-1) TaxID=1321606 RepID=A0A0A8XC96_MESS1|nr:NfeD family protein [Mesobacillus selenatarsenatis]GAM16647.1 putative membrane protein [Mesobacillus selenatarsenatis SF-1]